MLQQISHSLNQSPSLIQIALDEVWEKTWNLQPSDNVATEEIDQYLKSQKHENVAAELLFGDGENTFVFGIRHNHDLLVSEAVFLQTFITAVNSYQTFELFIQTLDKAFSAKPQLFQSEPDKIRVGVVNHWFSVGPCELWHKGETKQITQKQLETKFQLHPNVLRSPLNYQGMSFLFNFNEDKDHICHWMKSPCSQKTNNQWVVQIDNVTEYLQKWLNFQIS